MKSRQTNSFFAHWVALSQGIRPSHLLGAIGVSAFDGVFQALGVASILPFIALLADPGAVYGNPLFQSLTSHLPWLGDANLLFAAGLFALLMLLLSNALTVLDYWLSLKLFNGQRHRMALRLLRAYLNKDLLTFNQRKVSEMSTTVLSEVERVVIDTLMAGAGILTDLIVVVTVSALLLYVNPTATLIVLVCLGGVYVAIHLFTVREMERLGTQHAEAEAEMFAGVSQALTLFKEAKLAHRGGFFLERFATPSRRIVRVTNHYEILTFLPAQLLELLTFGLMLGVALHLTDGGGESSGAIVQIAFFAFAAYRLIPVLTSLLDGFETFRYGASVVDKVLNELESDNGKQDATPPLPRLELHSAITLDAVSFRYPESDAPTLHDISARIPAHCMTCIVGPSGAGKSTLLDIISGLLAPNTGRVLVDDVDINTTAPERWQTGIGYVPQQVQLFDGSLAANIALGETDIDLARVERAARVASIDQLVRQQLPAGFDTQVGDGGYLLSSGERQRIGIARALYHDPAVLLLDEATNELDEETEAKVLDQIAELRDLTVVFVTHKRALWARAAHVIQLAGRFS